jgi:DHA2 family multidrug resistance protein
MTRATARDWLAVFAAILGAFTAILDIQITNSSLANIEGTLGAGVDEGSWISTAYLMTEILVIPLTGWLSSVIGLRRFLVTNTVLFVVFSIACALSTNLHQMILFRASQGLTGGALIPTAIVIVRTRLPPPQQTIGIALFGLTATFAPAIGPSVGGWLTDNFSWHYIFYLNVLFGPAAALLQLIGLDKAPVKWRALIDGDWIGVGFMAVGLPALTLVLEEGQRKDWFGSPLIVKATIVAAVGILGFIVRELMAERPFINLRVLANRSVGGSSFLMAVLGAVSYGSIYIIPVYCAQIQGYNSQQIGYVVMWSGLPQLILLPLTPLLLRVVDARLLVAAGTAFFIMSCWINVDLTHDVGMDQLIWPQLLRAIGQPLFTIPLSQLSTAGLTPRDTADASSLSNMMRNLGGSIGISMLSTVIARREQFHFSMLAEAITANATRTQERLSLLTSAMQAHLADPAVAKARALAQLASQVRREAYVMAYADGFFLIGVGLVVSLGAIAILRKPQKAGSPIDAH